MRLILTVIKNWYYLWRSYKSINVLSNVIKGRVRFGEKVILFKRNNVSGDIKIGKGISMLKANIGGNVTIGNYCAINGPSTFIISGSAKISIGNYCSIARNVQIQAVYHNYNRVTSYSILKSIFMEKDEREYLVKGDIIIEDDVWIGANSIILSGVRVGRGAVVAAGAVVTKNVDPYTIVAGNPAKVIKYRFEPDTIQMLEATKWWQWDEVKVLSNKTFFQQDLNSR